MDYSTYTAKELAMDEHFQRWVLHPDDETINSFWKSWLEAHPEKHTTVEEARGMISQLSYNTYTLPQAEVAQIWSKVISVQDSHSFVRKVKHGWTIYQKVAVAAMVLLVLSLAWFANQLYLRTPEYQTAYGETQTIQLPDHSTVILNANSRLRLSSGWDATRDREVWLEGEAYFTVTHTQNHQKFIVHTADGLNVEVLGTEFNVSQRESGTKVVLSSGKVKLNVPELASSESVVMQPGELAEFSQHMLTRKMVDPQMYSAWTSKRLILNHTSLNEIAQMLKDNYGLDVQVSHRELLEQTVSGSMPLGDIDQLLVQIGKTFRLNIIRDKKQVIISQTSD